MSAPAPQPAIWAALPLPAFQIDAEGAVLDANPAAEALLRRPARTLRGRSLAAMLRPDTDLPAAIARVLDSATAMTVHDLGLRPGERRSTCDLQIAPLAEPGRPTDRLLVLLHMREIAGRLDRTLKARAAARTAIGMAGMLAHEIKNPLAGIAGAAQLLEMELPAEQRELTDLILQETRRVVDLLKQVERFGDLRPPRLVPVNIHDVLERARASARVGAARQMTFRDAYDPSLPPTAADADQLLQVFANLFANAAQAAGPEGGTITIRTFFEPGLRLQGRGGGRAVPLQVEIADDGPGIPAHLQDTLFEPFVSGRENGTGLGLALASKIVTDHGGTITVDSRPGDTRFRISLPVWRGETAAGAGTAP